MRRIEIWLLIAVVLLVAGWGLVWWLISEHVEGVVGEALAASAEEDVALACEERGQGGFPFRFETVCSGATARAADGAWRARLERFSAGAVVHRPRHIEAILTGPMQVEAVALDGPATIRWASARALIVAGADGPQRLLVRLFNASGEAPEAQFMSHQARLEVAPDAAGGSRLEYSVELLRLAVRGQALPPLDLTAEARTPIPAEALLAGDVDLSDGLSLSDIAVSLEAGQVEAFAEGAIEVGPDGVPSGSVTLSLVGVERLPALLEALPENVRSAANVAAGAVIALAAPAEWQGRPARRIVLTIEEGEVRAGPLSLGRLPPLWEPPASS